jgi:hypothetical protein
LTSQLLTALCCKLGHKTHVRRLSSQPSSASQTTRPRRPRGSAAQMPLSGRASVLVGKSRQGSAVGMGGPASAGPMHIWHRRHICGQGVSPCASMQLTLQHGGSSGIETAADGSVAAHSSSSQNSLRPLALRQLEHSPLAGTCCKGSVRTDSERAHPAPMVHRLPAACRAAGRHHLRPHTPVFSTHTHFKVRASHAQKARAHARSAQAGERRSAQAHTRSAQAGERAGLGRSAQAGERALFGPELRMT